MSKIDTSSLLCYNYKKQEIPMLQLNQIFTAKPPNGKYHRGRVIEVQENQTFEVQMYQFNEITARPTFLESLTNFPKLQKGIFTANIRLKDNVWSFCNPAPKTKNYTPRILINEHENFKWQSSNDTYFGKVKKVSTDRETNLPLIEVAINDSLDRIRIFIYKKDQWVRHDLNPLNLRYQEILPKIIGTTTDFDLARLFREEQSKRPYG
jgi:hypothetical protein